MRALVTGGAGFIGSHLADALLAAGHDVAVVDDLSAGRRENVPPRAEATYADVGSPGVSDFVRAWRPDVVFHHAARVNLRESLDDPARDARTNVVATLSLLEACRRLASAHFVFASTGGGLYGDGARFPTPESETPRPLSPYGCGKQAVEGYLGYYRRVHGLASCSLRYGNVYGPRQDARGDAGVVAIFTQRCLAGEPLVVHGSGDQTRDYVYVADVVRANLECARRRVEGVFNVATGRETSVNALARSIREAAGASAPVEHGPERAGDARRSCLDPSALRAALGWSPTTPLADGLAATADWFRRRPASADPRT